MTKGTPDQPTRALQSYIIDMEMILVLSGVTKREDVDRFPYRPTRILPSVAEIEV